MLQEIHYIKYYNIEDTKKQLMQIINRIDVDKINTQISDDLDDLNSYFNKKNIHIICSNCEYTKMIVEDYVIKIKSNQNCPLFLKYLKEDNLFICDFVYREYFFLNLEKIIA